MTGQVFVVRGDLRRLACDAWLLPTDAFFNRTAAFKGDNTPSEEEFKAATREGWNNGSVLPVGEKPSEKRPWIWLGNIGTHRIERSDDPALDGFVQVVEEFADRVGKRFGAECAREHRLPRLAINVIGMGFVFRQRKRLGRNSWVNVSKSGASLSGKSGCLTLNSRGTGSVRLGRGLSYRFGRRR